ncbi:MAG: hypothetical protein JNL82_02050 [Myxococcales bacterium]|nr:hypothetical protein [Myxococcales bacterium]
MYTHAPTILACASIGLFAATAAAGPALVSRPHGNAMGDGLGERGELTILPGPGLGKQSCAAGATTFGIDVSYYQGDIDWGAVAASGVKFAWTRVSHSTQFQDPKFQQNLAGARAAGIHTGVYQYFEPGEDPVAQAQLLIDLTGELQPGDMPPMIDVESPDPVAPAAYADAIAAWIGHIEAAYGVQPFIYTGYYYWNDNVGSDQFAGYPLWIANYNPGCPLIPDYWPAWVAHQFCACGSIPGIAGDVDSNNFNGDEAVLDGYAVGGAVCGDGKCVFSEDAYNCAADCPPCGTIPPEGGTVDDGQACYELGGPLEYWRHEAAGQGGSLYWTAVTEYADPSNYAVWRLYFAEAGLYELSVWIEQPFGETAQSSYVVRHAGGETVVPLSQAAQATGWASLGEFTFDAASDHSVRVNDNTGELQALELALVADALRVTRVDGGEASSGGEATSLDPDTGGETGVGSTGGLGGTTGGPGGATLPAGPTSSETGADTGGGHALPDGYGEDGGCGCRSTGPSSLLLGLVALLPRRRRRG